MTNIVGGGWGEFSDPCGSGGGWVGGLIPMPMCRGGVGYSRFHV